MVLFDDWRRQLFHRGIREKRESVLTPDLKCPVIKVISLSPTVVQVRRSQSDYGHN